MKIKEACAWAAKRKRSIRYPSEGERAALELIEALPDEIIPTDKLQELIAKHEEILELEAGGTWPYAVRQEFVADLKALFPAPDDAVTSLSGESQKSRIYDDGGPIPPGHLMIPVRGRTDR